MTTWTDGMIARLRVLHSEDRSFSKIAEIMSGDFHIKISRNAAIGKAARLGLVMRAIQPNRVVKPRGTRVRRKMADIYKPRKSLMDQAEEATEAVSLPPDQSPCAVSLMQLGPHHCRWPIDGADGVMMYCGAGTLEGGSYCGRHHRLAYRRHVRVTPEERLRRMHQAQRNNARAVA